MKILVAEDELHLRQGLVEIFVMEGYEVFQAADGEQAWAQYLALKPDCVCLDIMMPKMNGYTVCRKIRQQDEHVPIIFITAKSEEIDKVLGLELGADDYIAKPFGIKEVVARIRAVTRRYFKTAKPNVQTFRMGTLDVSPTELRAKRGQTLIDLSLRDLQILTLLFEHAGQAVSRDALFDACWGKSYLPSSRTLDQHISTLRKRVELDPKQPTIIRTVHGVGYRFEG